MKRRKSFILYSISFLIVAIIVGLVIKETKTTEGYSKNVDTNYLAEEKESITIINNNVKTSQKQQISEINLEETEGLNSEKEEIKELMMRYFEAVNVCSVEMLNSIVESNEKVSQEILNEKAQYIEEYTDFTYYIEKGLAQNTYIVYVCYHIKLKQLDTAVPALERFYIKRNSDAAVYIYRGELDGELATYIQEVEKHECVVLLRENIERSFQNACLKEPELKNMERIIESDIWIKEQ